MCGGVGRRRLRGRAGTGTGDYSLLDWNVIDLGFHTLPLLRYIHMWRKWVFRTEEVA